MQEFKKYNTIPHRLVRPHNLGRYEKKKKTTGKSRK